MTGLTSPTHIALLLVVLLLVFGAKRLPEFGRSLGTGMREFKHSVSGEAGTEPAALAPNSPPDLVPQPPPVAASTVPAASTVADAHPPRPAA
jgi:sec-independent protein translocase protein TatA